MTRDGRAAFEWGLASIAIGGVLVIGAFTAWANVAYTADPFATSGDWIVRAQSLSFGALLALSGLTAFAGVGSGLRSIMLARREARPLALGLSGVLLSILAMVAWTGVALSWGEYIGTSGMQGGFGGVPM
jgi:hypothetical protein